MRCGLNQTVRLYEFGPVISFIALIRDEVHRYTDKTELSYSDAKEVRDNLYNDNPWLRSGDEIKNRKQAVKDCLSSCSSHIDSTIIEWNTGDSLCG
jgi:hypothetical protein